MAARSLNNEIASTYIDDALRGVEADVTDLDDDMKMYLADSLVDTVDSGDVANLGDVVGAVLQACLPLTDDQIAQVCECLCEKIKMCEAAAGPKDATGTTPSLAAPITVEDVAENIPDMIPTPADDEEEFLFAEKAKKQHSKSKAGREKGGAQSGDAEKEESAVKKIQKKFHEEDIEYSDEYVRTQASMFWRDRKDPTFFGEKRDVDLTGLTMFAGDKELLANANLRLHCGHRYGLVGRNGVGKSTLLQRIAAGKVQRFPDYLGVLYVGQEVIGDERTVLERVLDVESRRRKLEQEEEALLEVITATEDESERAEADARLVDLYEELEQVDDPKEVGRAHRILDGLLFTAEMKEAPTKSLSGGWRMRVALAQALLEEPAILFLDEPTNHLDLEAVLWLEWYLNSLENVTVVCVSHDPVFLDNVTTDTILMRKGTLEYYPGNYSEFQEWKQNIQQRQSNFLDKQSRQIAHMQKTIANMRKKAKENVEGTSMKTIRSRVKAINRMGQPRDDGKRWRLTYDCPRPPLWIPDSDPAIRFSFARIEKPKAAVSLLRMEDVSFRYEGMDTDVLSNVTMSLDMGNKFGIVGVNGSGKSTLVGLLSGSLRPQRGKVELAHNVKVGVFAQHVVDDLPKDQTPIDHVRELFPNESGAEVRRRLGALGVTGDMATRPIETLSGGQKARVAMAVMTWEKPQIMILDEPTNHLDFSTIEALVDAVGSFEGAVVIVSHHQYLLSHTCNVLFHVEGGHVKRFDGDFYEYIDELRARINPPRVKVQG